MKLTTKILSASLLSISCFVGVVNANTAPMYMVTHNQTDVQSNAFIDGTIDSGHPTQPRSDKKVLWSLVHIVCLGHIDSNNACKALVKVATNTRDPITLGTMSMNVLTGDITPKQLTDKSDRYLLTVNGPGEVTLTQKY